MDFPVSARHTDSPLFVIEADEYDTRFFDKRSKFVHYRPRTAVLNNLEFDHADIFDDLAAIERQFHHLVRTVPHSGRLVGQRKRQSAEAGARSRSLVAGGVVRHSRGLAGGPLAAMGHSRFAGRRSRSDASDGSFLAHTTS
jgi:UDP-N-acetylmuramate: L-alanyl-gamma-D-glutamyl-meso-diaminopimelate ligase